MQADHVNEILVQFYSFTISAKGIVAIAAVAVPLALLLVAIAWRIAGGKLMQRNISTGS